MKNIVIIAATVAATLATPSFARVEGRFGEAKMVLNEKTGEYWLKERVSGRMTPLVTCRTADAWADAGLTISRKSVTRLAQR